MRYPQSPGDPAFPVGNYNGWDLVGNRGSDPRGGRHTTLWHPDLVYAVLLCVHPGLWGHNFNDIIYVTLSAEPSREAHGPNCEKEMW